MPRYIHVTLGEDYLPEHWTLPESLIDRTLVTVCGQQPSCQPNVRHRIIERHKWYKLTCSRCKQLFLAARLSSSRKGIR